VGSLQRGRGGGDIEPPLTHATYISPTPCRPTESYRRTIARGCEWAFPPPAPLAKTEDETDAQWRKRLTKAERAESKAWRKAHSWHPHQLRHNAATFIRKEFTLETARIILGHHNAAVTEVYAERGEQEAIEAITKVG
jgi:integrase